MPDLISVIGTYLDINTDDPTPLGWTATAESILAKVHRARRRGRRVRVLLQAKSGHQDPRTLARHSNPGIEAVAALTDDHDQAVATAGEPTDAIWRTTPIADLPPERVLRRVRITYKANRCHPDRHEGLSTKSVQLLHGMIRGALQDAVRDGRLVRNPADLAQSPKRTASQRRVTSNQVWTATQAQDFLARTADHELAPLWVLALTTGLRRAELVGLTWSHLDLDAGYVEISKTTTVVRGRAVASLGKTSAAHRRVHLDAPVPDHLRRHLAAQQALRRPTGPDDPVFTDRHGDPINPSRLTVNFGRLLGERGLPNIGVHGLRHTAATLMLNRNVPVHLVANRLGHADASTTLSVYVHVMPSDDRLAARAISEVLFPDPDDAETGSGGRAVPLAPAENVSDLCQIHPHTPTEGEENEPHVD